MESLLNDLRFALRSLRKSPGFALATVLTLGLGIGANTAVFSLIHGVLLAPLPYREGDRLVVLQQSAPKAEVSNLAFSIKEVYDYREANRTLSGLVEHHSMTFTLLGRDEPERVSTGVVSAEFFDVLGLEPHLGRTFLSGDDDLGAEAVLVLSHGYWQRAFGGDPQVIGRTLEMNILLRPVRDEPILVEKDGVLVFIGEPMEDIGGALEKLRARRLKDLAERKPRRR